MRVAALLFLCAAGACVMAQPAPPAPSATDPLAVWERDTNVEGGRVIYARNDGKVPITVNWLMLYQCKNIDRACGEVNPNVTIQPGKTATVLRLNPAVPHGVMQYKFEIRYQFQSDKYP